MSNCKRKTKHVLHKMSLHQPQCKHMLKTKKEQKCNKLKNKGMSKEIHG